MSWHSILAAGLAYFALGGVWFTPLFGRQWDTAVGFERPSKWRPSAEYYIVPLFGCVVGAAATACFAQLSRAKSLGELMLVGMVAGIGYGAAITSTNAVAPNMRRPALYSVVVGSYHVTGHVLSSVIIYLMP